MTVTFSGLEGINLDDIVGDCEVAGLMEMLVFVWHAILVNSFYAKRSSILMYVAYSNMTASTRT